MGDDWMQKNRTFRPVYILGAGFSKAVSSLMPCANELGNEVLHSLRGHEPPAALTRGGFEEWLSRLAEDQPDLVEHENLLRRSYFSLVAQFVAIVIDDLEGQVVNQVAWDQGWLHRFVGLAHAQKATLVTYNYDTLIERAIDQSFLLDHSSLFGRRIHSCDVLAHMPPRVDVREGGPLATFRLLKLHGSTNFYWVPNDLTGGTLVRWPLPQEDHDAGPWAGQSVRDSPAIMVAASQVLFDEDPAKRRDRLLNGREPFIVPPSALKSRFYELPFLRGLWRQAREAIMSATHLYLVGYSLPRTDLATLGLLRENLPAGCEIAVVNEGPDKHEVVERCRMQLAELVSASVRGPVTIDEWINEVVRRQSFEVVARLARDLEVLVGGERGAASDRLVRVPVYRSDRLDYETAEVSVVGDGDDTMRLSMEHGRPIPLEPRWSLQQLSRFVNGAFQRSQPIRCQCSDGRESMIVGANLRRPERSADYEVICDCIPA